MDPFLIIIMSHAEVRVLKYLYEFFKNFEKTGWSVIIGT